MKRFDEYTKEEVAQWTDEDIQRLIEVELMIEGVATVPPPAPLNTTKPDIKPTTIVYKVKDLYVKSIEDAKTILEIQTFDQDYDSSIGYNFMWLKPCASYKEQITEVAFYAEADVRAIGTELKENERKQKEYDEDKKKYNDFIKATDGVRSDVRVCYREACQWMNAIEQATQILNKYRGLAGDEETAIKFFRDAYKEKPEIVGAVLGEASVE